jgi:HD-GYP domain-containing protein (c-di-GMP phosphodiesterase class II)
MIAANVAGPLYSHADALSRLDQNLPLNQKLQVVHEAIRESLPFVERVAVAAYDRERRVLKTFLASCSADQPLVRYEARLENAPALAEILRVGRPRVVNDLTVFEAGHHAHTAAIRRHGYRASYTMPVSLQGTFWGFVFFNSFERGCFTEAVLRTLDPYGHLVAAITVADLLAVRVLAAAVRTAHSMVHLRDPETGNHLRRMAEYSRIIARDLAERGRESFDDETIERLHLFAPLHDLGKIGIPDRLLLKPGTLTPEERAEMQTHPLKGLDMVERMMENFGLEQFPGLDMLRNVVYAHHEAVDGTGYPRGLQGHDIPIEARIVSVADVFDALTSRRPYKEPWSNGDSIDLLRRLAVDKLDADCVDALIRNLSQVEEIQARFREDATLETPSPV